mmetsp:Transcript_12449/g.20922  ORF Transcript_12449/g.20922 Transcript_12449/m.20922 type:complete len:147 (-) Transcript_12449:1704-2144(-)
MEKADKTLQNEIMQRRKQARPFQVAELLHFWRKIINVFAFCNVFNISHNDIKPSNILLVKTNAPSPSSDNQLNEAFEPKVSDFGTSMQVGDHGSEEQNVKILNADSMFTNHMQAMTPSYASPSILQNAPKIHNYLEDVFSLGVTFL